MWLPWDIALWCAAAFGALGVTIRANGRRWLEETLPVLREGAVILVLYAAWRILGEQSVMGVEGALGRGRWIWDFERVLHLPNEATLQHWCMHAVWLLRFANAYYIVAHVLPLGVFLVWLFFRHRDRYRGWRNVLAFVSLGCLLIQFVPVAPPRMYPQYGFIDAAAVYGPRVYDSIGVSSAGQLSAMPSMHVAWAMLIGLAVVRVSPSRWRWLALAHPALTMFSVTVTGYHWLLDGIVATAVLLCAMALGVWARGWAAVPAPRGVPLPGRLAAPVPVASDVASFVSHLDDHPPRP